MRKIQRLAAVGAMAALTVVLGACGSSEAPSTSAPSAAAPTSAPAASGVTQISDIFGPGCGAVPTSGEGSPQGMVDDPVATAASSNPVLSSTNPAVATLVAAVTQAGLVDTLNTAPALTVLAPSNDAFAKIPSDTLNMVLADKAALTKILTTHVWDKRMDAEGLVAAGKFTALSKETVTVGGTATEPTFTAAGDKAPAKTVCGNIPTANATVFVIDTVLTTGT